MQEHVNLSKDTGSLLNATLIKVEREYKDVSTRERLFKVEVYFGDKFFKSYMKLSDLEFLHHAGCKVVSKTGNAGLDFTSVDLSLYSVETKTILNVRNIDSKHTELGLSNARIPDFLTLANPQDIVCNLKSLAVLVVNRLHTKLQLYWTGHVKYMFMELDTYFIIKNSIELLIPVDYSDSGDSGIAERGSLNVEYIIPKIKKLDNGNDSISYDFGNLSNYMKTVFAVSMTSPQFSKSYILGTWSTGVVGFSSLDSFLNIVDVVYNRAYKIILDVMKGDIDLRYSDVSNNIGFTLMDVSTVLYGISDNTSNEQDDDTDDCKKKGSFITLIKKILALG